MKSRLIEYPRDKGRWGLIYYIAKALLMSPLPKRTTK